jgi:hypothetical protein
MCNCWEKAIDASSLNQKLVHFCRENLAEKNLKI